ncbi:MAG: SpoIIE family protein phosphatase [Deltaproteobacteria bacterium]|nr:SpoIIE family protein phosphatase [Deltaproteobacteria bacterium]
MAEVRPRRAGIPISVKLILATSFVVAAAVGTAAWFSATAISDLTTTMIEDRTAIGQRAIARESELVVKPVANAAAAPLSVSKVDEVEQILDRAIEDDIADLQRERKLREAKISAPPERIQWLVVTLPCVEKDCVIGKFVTWSDPATMASRKAGKAVTERPATVPDDAKLAVLKGKLADGTKSGEVSQTKVEGGTVYGTPIILGTRIEGRLWMGVTTKELEEQLQEAVAKAEASATEKRTRSLLVSLVVLGIGILLAALQGVQLAKPIKQLTMQAERIGDGDLSLRVPENRRDELGVLAHTFNVMADEIYVLLEQQVQKASLEKEMELARQVQQAMLPPETLDEHGPLKIVGYCMPASSCGGDWWTYRKLQNGRMLLVVGDATGHGIHSAIIAATARGAVEALSGIDERLLTPEQVLKAIDSAIRQVGEHNVLMTAFASVFDAQTGILHYANAGQNFPYVIKLDGRVLGEASIIAASGNPLGDRNIAVEIRRGSLQLRPGDLFVCFTDGVVERANPAGKLFGDRRLRNALMGQPLPDADALVRLRDLLVQTLDQYGDGAIAEDDITFVLCQYDPQGESQTRTSQTRSSARRGAA